MLGETHVACLSRSAQSVAVLDVNELEVREISSFKQTRNPVIVPVAAPVLILADDLLQYVALVCFVSAFVLLLCWHSRF